MTESDAAFVRSTWFKSHWVLHAKKFLSFDVYKDGQNARIDRLLRASSTTIVTPYGLPEHICAYIVHAHNVVHYVYVRRDYRKLGIASGLLHEKEFKWHSHPAVSPASQSLVASHRLRFNPYLVETP